LLISSSGCFFSSNWWLALVFASAVVLAASTMLEFEEFELVEEVLEFIEFFCFCSFETCQVHVRHLLKLKFEINSAVR